VLKRLQRLDKETVNVKLFIKIAHKEMVGQDAVLKLLECEGRFTKVLLKDDKFNQWRLALNCNG
jgi:hypothetical protein